MSLVLRPVQASSGMRWIGDALRLFAKRPLAFSALFMVYLFALMVVSLLPRFGLVLQMLSLPLLSLGFMIAARSALFGGPVHPAQFIEPLRGDPAKRKALLMLCLGYALGALALLLLADAVSGGAAAKLQELMQRPTPPAAEIDALLSQPRTFWGAVTLLVGGTALAVPFWHAPALVHWGGQGLGQALFSSTLAVWRGKAAFLLYALGWLGLISGFGIVTALLLSLVGAAQFAPLFTLPGGLLFSTLFYVSLIFTFNDCFWSRADERGPQAPSGEDGPEPPSPPAASGWEGPPR